MRVNGLEQRSGGNVKQLQLAAFAADDDVTVARCKGAAQRVLTHHRADTLQRRPD